MPLPNHPHPELAPKAHVEGRTIDLQPQGRGIGIRIEKTSS
jgi:hypothetical protein